MKTFVSFTGTDGFAVMINLENVDGFQETYGTDEALKERATQIFTEAGSYSVAHDLATVRQLVEAAQHRTAPYLAETLQELGVLVLKCVAVTGPSREEFFRMREIAVAHCLEPPQFRPSQPERQPTEWWHDGRTQLLMSKGNPHGWKLEELLAVTVRDIMDKSARIAESTSPNAQIVRDRNDAIISLLEEARKLQLATMALLDNIGLDQGPDGESRL